MKAKINKQTLSAIAIVVLLVLTTHAAGFRVYTSLQDTPDYTSNWNVDVSDLIADVKANQTVDWHAGPYGIVPVKFEQVDFVDFDEVPTVAANGTVVGSQSVDLATFAANFNTTTGAAGTIQLVTSGSNYLIASSTIHTPASTPTIQRGYHVIDYEPSDSHTIRLEVFFISRPVPFVEAFANDECDDLNQMQNAIWYDSYFSDIVEDAPAYITAANFGATTSFVDACVEQSFSLASLATAPTDSAECTVTLWQWHDWVNDTYPEQDRIAGNYATDNWQLFTGQLVEDCGGQGYKDRTLEGDADFWQINVIAPVYEDCTTRFLFTVCDEEVPQARTSGYLIQHEIGHAMAYLEHDGAHCEDNSGRKTTGPGVMADIAPNTADQSFCIPPHQVKIMYTITDGNTE